MGFEPTRAEPNGLAVHRLNHSATSSARSLRQHTLISIESHVYIALYNKIHYRVNADIKFRGKPYQKYTVTVPTINYSEQINGL